MQKTKIEWCDYTTNPVKGKCPMACSYCYARKMYDRFKWNPEIRFGWNFTPPKKPSRIFVGSTMELFGDWIPDSWLRNIFNFCSQWPEHTFLFLTKQPQNLIKWSPFPDNCWVGVSITDRYQAHNASHYFSSIEAKVKFISFEPLLDDVMQALYCWNVIKAAQWVIIGAQTKPYKPPKIEWVREIVQACDKAGIPVFLKQNLFNALSVEPPFFKRDESDGVYAIRQEMPKGV